MILVMLGTQNNSFHRLLEEIEKEIEKGIIKEKVIVQSGHTKYNSDKMEIIDMMPREELNKLQKEASLIITHGGVGSIISSITKEKKVIAVPRLHEFGEHVNDHQKEIVELFNEKGYIIGIKSVEELGQALKEIAKFEPKKYIQDNSKLIGIVDDFIAKSIKGKE